jgi:tryptophan synthase beta chain
MGMFGPFRDQKEVGLYGVEAGGKSISSGFHGASISAGRVGVLHGNKTYILQDGNGQVREAYSVAAGLDYPGVGPEHSYFHSTGRAEYVVVTDDEARAAFLDLSRLEGIIPAMESAHAVAFAMKLARKLERDRIIVVNLSGRGDKDAAIIEQEGKDHGANRREVQNAERKA